MTAFGAMIMRDIPPEQVAAHAASLASGFAELWTVEDLPYAGAIAQISAVLAATEDVVVGHGIAPAPFRNPMALAMEWATLARLFPGRLACGIGHGVPSWMRDIGEGVESPLALLEETIVGTQALLAGRDPELAGRYRRMSGHRLKFPPNPVPIVSAGVVGPRSLELSGRVAGGTILSEGHGPAEITAARRHIEAGRQAAASTDHHRLTVFASFYCGALGDLPPPPLDNPRGWAAIGPTAGEVAAQLAAIIEVGIDALVLVPFGDSQSQLDVAINEVLPLLG